MTETIRLLHFPGDNCAGEARILGPDDGRAIRSITGRLLRAADADDFDGAFKNGAFIGRHYGPDGEWFLAALLAEFTCAGVPLVNTGRLTSPQVRTLLPDADPQAVAMIAALAAHHRQTESPTDQARALDTTADVLQAFLNHFTHHNLTAAHGLWRRVYARDSARPLHALAFTVLLVLCAARSTFAARVHH